MKYRPHRTRTKGWVGTGLPSSAALFGGPSHVCVLSTPEFEARQRTSESAHPPAVQRPLDRDEALLLRIAGGDAGAIGALYERTAGLVYANVRRILDEPTLCSDVTQGVFQDLSGMVERFDADCGDSRDWLLALAHRRATERLNDGAPHAGAAVDQRVDMPSESRRPALPQIGARLASTSRAVLANASTRRETE